MPAFLPAELPVRAVAQHHWIVLLRPPRRWAAITLLVLVLLAWIWPWPFLWVLVTTLVVTAVMRWRLWRADRIYLTGLRVIEVSGVPELTRSERFLRLDRIAGAEIVQSFWGNLLDYATIELTAPGDRVDVRHFPYLADPHRFYQVLRGLSLGIDTGSSRWHDDEDAVGPDEYTTAPLPDLGEGGYGGHGDHGHGGWD